MQAAKAKASPASCYACDAMATEDEHLPPRCIFPRGDEHRKALIKVPSCSKHNSQKSTNDELLRHVLVMAPQTNELAFQVIKEAALPALERRPHLLHTFFPKLTPVKIDGRETRSFRIDLKRFYLSVRMLVRGLYFHEYGEKLHTQLPVAWGALTTPSLRSMPFYPIIQRGQSQLPPIDRGANPRVFRYAFDRAGDNKSMLCRLQFYEGVPIYVPWRWDLK